MRINEAERIDMLVDIYSYLSDETFWGVLEELGVYPEDIEIAERVLRREYGDPLHSGWE